MMKKSRWVALALAGILVCGTILTGCGDNGGNNDAGGQNNSSETGGAGNSVENDGNNGVETPDGEPYEVVMSFPYYGTLKPDLQMIEDAMNEISVAEINVKMTMLPLAMNEVLTQQSLMISSNEKLDLMLGMRQSGFLELINKKMAIPLDELFEKYGKEIEEIQGVSMAGGYLDGVLYGIPSIEKMARIRGFIALKSACDAYGLDYENEIGYEEMEAAFAKAKEANPEGYYPLAIAGSNLTTFEYFYNVDLLGADIACGGIFDNGHAGSEIRNIFATDEYMEHCRKMHEWYEKGYISPDATTRSEMMQDLIKNGTAFIYPSWTELDMVSRQSRGFGEDAVAITTQGKSVNTGVYQGQCWMIPVTCENPDAAFQYLKLLYTNEDMINLLYYGIEGTHYVLTDQDRIIQYPEGIDGTSVGWSNALGLFGAIAKRYEMVPLTSDYFTMRDEFNNSITDAEKSPYLGYAFNTETVKTEYAAVTDVITQYRASLESGSVDPEVVMPEFLNALEAAGINTCIEANQKSLNEWIEAQK